MIRAPFRGYTVRILQISAVSTNVSGQSLDAARRLVREVCRYCRHLRSIAATFD